ncbi:MAG: sulfate ABC transporter permease subunit CysT [Hyphomonadaceae bacterium]
MSEAAISAPPRRWRFREWSALPGFWPSLGFTLVYLSFFVLLPLAALALRPWEIGLDGVWRVISAPRTVAALQLSFGAALLAALINLIFAPIAAWVLVRYDFPGKKLLDSLVDLPFALPTAVAGISLAAIYAPNGWVGALFMPLDIRIAYTPLGVLIALIFVGFPFIVRAVQPVLEDLDKEMEEAAATLGASRWRTITKVIIPTLAPSLIAGFSLAFARAVGEYGSVIFIAGNLPMISEIAPLVIIIHLEEFNYAGAAAVGLTMLAISFTILLALNAWQGALARRGKR